MTNQEKYINALRKITGNTNPEMHNGDLYVDAFAAIADGEGGGGGTGAFFVPLTFVREEDDMYIFTGTVSPDTIVEKYGAHIPVYFYSEFMGATMVIPVVTARKPDLGVYEIIGNYVIAEEDGAMVVPQLVYDSNSEEYVIAINEFVIPDIPEIPDPDDAGESGMALMSNRTNKYILGWPIRKITLDGVLELVDDAEALRLTGVTAGTMDNYVSTNAQLRINATGFDTTVTFIVSGINETAAYDNGATVYTFDCVFDGHVYSASQLDQEDEVVFVKRS